MRELMSWCDKAGGNSEQKQHRCGSRCYRASLGEIHGRPLPRDSRWRCSRIIASAMSRVADISPAWSMRPKQSLAASCAPAGSGPTLPPMPEWAGLKALPDHAVAELLRALLTILRRPENRLILQLVKERRAPFWTTGDDYSVILARHERRTHQLRSQPRCRRRFGRNRVPSRLDRAALRFPPAASGRDRTTRASSPAGSRSPTAQGLRPLRIWPTCSSASGLPA